LYPFTRRVILLLSTSYKIVFNILPSSLSLYTDEIIEDNQLGFDITDQLLIEYLHLSDTGEKIGVQ
jgi:hypothetical protein